MTANLTRRRMLAAAGIGTAAAAFTGAASAQCRNDVKWDETHEIVVVGAGGAGMAAAVKAAQTGASSSRSSPSRAATRSLPRASSTPPTPCASRVRASRTRPKTT